MFSIINLNPFCTNDSIIYMLFCTLLFLLPLCRLLHVSSFTASSIFFTVTQFRTIQMCYILKPFPHSSQQGAGVDLSI